MQGKTGDNAFMKLSYAVSPMRVNQPFGANPEYYARFHDDLGQPEKGHMGIDFMAMHGTPLYAPCDGEAKYVVDSHGGDGIYLTFKDGEQWYKVILWHMVPKGDTEFPFQIPTDGSTVSVKRGQLLGYTDNSGAPFESSGDHLHFGLMPLQTDGIRTLYPANGYGGCIDPMPYFDGTYANDPVEAVVATAQTITNEVASLPQSQQNSLLPSLKAAVDSLVAFLKSKGIIR